MPGHFCVWRSQIHFFHTCECTTWFVIFYLKQKVDIYSGKTETNLCFLSFFQVVSRVHSVSTNLNYKLKMKSSQPEVTPHLQAILAAALKTKG